MRCTFVFVILCRSLQGAEDYPRKYPVEYPVAMGDAEEREQIAPEAPGGEDASIEEIAVDSSAVLKLKGEGYNIIIRFMISVAD